MYVLIWVIDNQQYAMDLLSINRILLATEITPLPNAPDHILGAINVHGKITPVVNMRILLGLPQKEIGVSDRFILCRFHQSEIALWVDSIKYVKLCIEKELISAQQLMPDLKNTEYVLKENGVITPLCDLNKLISLKSASLA